jgi:sirohydrochlorin ferrochelatase
MRISPKRMATLVGLCLVLGLVFVSFTAASAQDPQRQQLGPQSPAGGVGILLLAHGGSQKWNDEVLKIAAEVNKETPVEVAFGMANKRTIQDGIDKLSVRGAKQIVAVPLFISSHSSVITSTQYLLGLRKEAPADLALFAKMDHSHNTSGAAMTHTDAVGPIKPVTSPAPIRMTGALDHHPLVAEILLERAKAISQEPTKEVVIVVAHGPVPEDDNAKWLADMKSLVGFMKAKSSYQRIEYQTVRDDAPEPLRAQATAELRTRVEAAIKEGNKVLIVPLLLSYGGIEQGIRKRLDGLDYVISKHGLLPDERLAQWVKGSASAATK